MKPPSKHKKTHHPTKVPEQGNSKRKSLDHFFLYSFIIRNSFLIGISLVFALILIIFHNFLFANLYYLFKDIGSDSLNWTYPSYLHISEYLRTEGFPLWSFSQGMGQSVANSMNDPFSWLVYIAGAENLAYSMIWMEALKILVTAVLFYHFLRYWNLSGVTKVIGTVLYSFSGFMIVGSGWTIFSTEACYLALLLLSFERLYKNGSWYLFPIAVLLITILQPFDLYLYGLFLFCYFLLRHLTSEESSLKRFFKTLGQIVVFGLLGLMISCFFLVFFIQIIIDSPRIGGSSSYFTQLFSQPLFFTEKSIYYTTSILRLFHNDLIGNGSKFYGWYNYLEAPMFYIGIFPLLLFPQIFFLEGRRKKVGYAIFSGLLLFLLIFPFFRYAIWLFSGDYFRGFSLFISVPLLLFGLSAFSAFDNGKKINPYILIATAVVLIFLLYFPYTGADQIIRSDIQSDVRNFIVIYTIILLLFTIKTYNQILSVVLMLIIIIEAGYFNYKTLKERDVLSRLEMNQKIGYNDFGIDAIKNIKSYDKQFFRVNKDFSSNPAMHTSFNDAKAQGFFGTRSYYSFNQKYYIRFLEEMLIIKKGSETMSRWSIGLSGRPLLQILASTKYQLIRGTILPPFTILYDSLNMFGDVKVLKNRNYLPLGFTYNNFLRLSVFRKASTPQKEFILQKTCVIDDSLSNYFESFPGFSMTDTVSRYSILDLSHDVIKRKEDTLNITRFTENRIEGTINPKTKKILFFSIPYDRGWHGKIDGNETKLFLINIGFIGMIVEPGFHKIDLYYRPPYFFASMMVSVFGLLIYLSAIVGSRFLIYRKRSKN